MRKIIIWVVFLALICLLGLYIYSIRNIIKPGNDAKTNITKQQKDSIAVKYSDKRSIIPGEFKTKTGKSIIINETHPIGMSLSDVEISTRGFQHNKTIRLKEIDPIREVILADLDKDGFEETYIFTQSVGSGSAGDFIIYASDQDEKLVKVLVHTDVDYLKGGLYNGYMGHDNFFFEEEMLVREFPIYKATDTNAEPTGGKKKLFYILNNKELELVKVETIK